MNSISRFAKFLCFCCFFSTMSFTCLGIAGAECTKDEVLQMINKGFAKEEIDKLCSSVNKTNKPSDISLIEAFAANFTNRNDLFSSVAFEGTAIKLTLNEQNYEIVIKDARIESVLSSKMRPYIGILETDFYKILPDGNRKRLALKERPEVINNLHILDSAASHWDSSSKSWGPFRETR